jgi:hypothetical protein
MRGTPRRDGLLKSDLIAVGKREGWEPVAALHSVMGWGWSGRVACGESDSQVASS